MVRNIGNVGGILFCSSYRLRVLDAPVPAFLSPFSVRSRTHVFPLLLEGRNHNVISFLRSRLLQFRRILAVWIISGRCMTNIYIAIWNWWFDDLTNEIYEFNEIYPLIRIKIILLILKAICIILYFKYKSLKNNCTNYWQSIKLLNISLILKSIIENQCIANGSFWRNFISLIGNKPIAMKKYSPHSLYFYLSLPHAFPFKSLTPFRSFWMDIQGRGTSLGLDLSRMSRWILTRAFAAGQRMRMI